MQPICLICIESIDTGKKSLNCMGKNILILKCDHTYHKKCLSPWIRENPLCPYCLTIINNNFNCYIISNKLKYKCVFFVDKDNCTVLSSIYPDKLNISSRFIKNFQQKKNKLMINYLNDNEFYCIVLTGGNKTINKIANTIKTIYNYQL